MYLLETQVGKLDGAISLGNFDLMVLVMFHMQAEQRPSFALFQSVPISRYQILFQDSNTMKQTIPNLVA